MDSGLTRLPFNSFEANATWMMTVALAVDLVRGFQLLCCDGAWSDGRPKALRWGVPTPSAGSRRTTNHRVAPAGNTASGSRSAGRADISATDDRQWEA